MLYLGTQTGRPTKLGHIRQHNFFIRSSSNCSYSYHRPPLDYLLKNHVGHQDFLWPRLTSTHKILSSFGASQSYSYHQRRYPARLKHKVLHNRRRYAQGTFGTKRTDHTFPLFRNISIFLSFAFRRLTSEGRPKSKLYNSIFMVTQDVEDVIITKIIFR